MMSARIILLGIYGTSRYYALSFDDISLTESATRCIETQMRPPRLDIFIAFFLRARFLQGTWTDLFIDILPITFGFDLRYLIPYCTLEIYVLELQHTSCPTLLSLPTKAFQTSFGSSSSTFPLDSSPHFRCQPSYTFRRAR